MRSTRKKLRHEALAVAFEFERVERLAQLGAFTRIHTRQVVTDILRRNGDEDGVDVPKCGEWLNGWIKVRATDCAPGTVTRYGSTVSSFLECLGKKAERPINTITPTDVQEYISARLADGCSPTTVQNDGKALRAAFNRAKREGHVIENPATKVDLPRRQSVAKSVFTPEEVGRILDVAEGEWRNMILIAYYTGARLSECSRVRKEDIDFERGVIAFPKTKQGKVHTTVLHPDLARVLRSAPDGYVCPILSQTPANSNVGLSNTFSRLMQEAGIDPGLVKGSGKRRVSKRSFHSLRHTYNSILANQGVSSEVRMLLLGHTTATVNRGYTHHEHKVLAEALERLPGVVG